MASTLEYDNVQTSEDATIIEESVVEVVDDDDDDDEGEVSLEVSTTADSMDSGDKPTRPQLSRKKKRKEPSTIGARYPTQYMKIGEIKCIFLSCFYQGRSPFLTLGPSWPFTSVLLLLAGLILGYFYMMIRLGDDANWLHMLWCKFCVGVNLFCLFAGILNNPGIPQRHIDRLLKEQRGKSEDSSAGDVEMEDIESGGNSISTSKQAAVNSQASESRLRGMIWCQYCMLETNAHAYHCDDCDVCIEDYDHHCVFFSKCIGGGNLTYFWATLGGVLFNFINIAIMLGVTAYLQGGLKKETVEEAGQNVNNTYQAFGGRPPSP